ncbi:MAG: hypothetical protein K9M98_09130, partial [Cephaloticoccus sp.]|nr:hypothetical protein [Cephaloticoccus sp.]
SAVTGRVDGMVFVGGLLLGLVGFAEVYPYVEPLTKMTSMGKVTLAGLFNIPYGLLVLAVVVMAIGAFVAAEWAEKVVGGRQAGPGDLLEPVRRITPVRGFALGFVAMGFVALFAGNPYRTAFATIDTKQLAIDAGTAADHVSVAQLADWIVEGRNDYVLVDVRDAAEFAAYHIPGAINIPLAGLTADFASRNERIVFYSDGGIHAAQAWLLIRSLGFPSAYMLFGGLEEWKDVVLYPVAPAVEAAPKDQIEFAKRAAVAKFFGGTPRGAGSADANPGTPEMPQLTVPVVAPGAPTATPPPRRKKKEGC